VPFPIYYQRDRESLREIAERFMTVIKRSSPDLVTKAPISWPAMRTLGLNTGSILVALGRGISDASDLLLNPKAWEEGGLFAEAVRRNPEAEPAVSYFRQHYLPLSRPEQAKLRSSFLDQLVLFTHDPALKATFGGRQPGLDWEAVETPLSGVENGQAGKTGRTVLLDFSQVTDPEARRFALHWIFSSVEEHLKARGRRPTPFVLTIDEFASLAAKTAGGNPLSELIAALLQQVSRANQVFFCAALQSLFQVDFDLAQTLLRAGTIICGRIATMQEARLLADVLFKKDPMLVKHSRIVWGRTPYVRGVGGGEYFPLGEVPMYSSLPEQLETQAQRLTSLKLWEFLVRPAIREGEVSGEVVPFTIAKMLPRDPVTNACLFPDESLITPLRHLLAKRSSKALREARLKPSGVAAAQRTAIQPPPGKPPPPPRSEPLQLDAEEQAFLRFIIDHHPDTPVAAVYKGVGVRVRRGNALRDRLKAQGFIADLEGRSSAGRKTSVLLPTFHAFEALGVAPPQGRGGAVHRHLQQLVVAGAKDKGYSAHVEKPIGKGGIVDVHLERDGVKIAVEIAVVSTVERELAHIRASLAEGYDQVYGIFADEHLLVRAAQAIEEAFSQEELGKVRLVPVSRLSHLGE
jgi:hypothetical protein